MFVAAVGAGAEQEAAARHLEGEIAEVCGVLHATSGRLVELIGRVLATGAWAGAGIRSAAQRVAWQCGVSPRRARTLVAMASRLAELPVTRSAFGAGALSEDQVAVVCRHTPAVNDAEMADLASVATVAQLERVLRTYRFQPGPAPTPPASTDPADAVDPDDGSATEAPAPATPVVPLAGREEETRRVTFGTTDDDHWSMHVRLPLDEGALVERALIAARQDLFGDRDGASDRADISWADALLTVAERSLDHPTVERPRRDRYLTLLHLHARARPAAGTGGRDTDGGGDRHADHAQGDVPAPRQGPAPWPMPPGHLHGGPALPDALRRLLTCDGTIRPVHHLHGVPVSVGRTRRIVPDRTRILIEERDRGCRVPGCDRRRWLPVHHIIHWEDGGTTDTDNLVALCGPHHRLHHRGQLGITGDPEQRDGLTFTDAHGRALRPHPRPPDRAGPRRVPPDNSGSSAPPYVHPTGERLDRAAITFREPAQTG